MDKNDAVSVPLLPLSTLNNTPNTNNQVANVTKANGAKGNRKQQQQQQQKPSQSNASTGRKNGKTNGKNQNGKNWKQRLTSPRPPTPKDRTKYDPINGISIANKTTITTTVRPIKLSNNNVDNKDGEKTVYIKSPVKAPKQVKEIISGSNTRIDIGSAATIKNPASMPTTTATPLDEHVEQVASFQYTSNPNMPNLFQRYEKIQEFYPEFHPYVQNIYPKASSSVVVGGVSGGAVAGKPSRDGSKHNHFVATSNQQVPASVPIDMSTSRNQDTFAQQKVSPSRTQSSAIISSTNGKG